MLSANHLAPQTVAAIEVVKRLEALEWRCAWLRGGTVEELQQGLDSLARTAVPSVQQEDKADDALEKLKAWFASHDLAVLAIDDAREDALQYLEDKVLPPGRGRVLMTGANELSQSNFNMELKTFAVEDSVALIKQKFDGRFSAYPDVYSLAFEEDGNNKRLMDFLSDDLVDNLPIIVDQVGQLLLTKAEDAGLRKKGLSDVERREKCSGLLASTIEEISKSAYDVDDTSLPANDRHLRGLLGTVRLWVDRIRSLPDRELSEASLGLLHACGLLAKQGIPWSLLQTFSYFQNMERQDADENPLGKAALELPSTGNVTAGSGSKHKDCGVLESDMQKLSLNATSDGQSPVTAEVQEDKVAGLVSGLGSCSLHGAPPGAFGSADGAGVVRGGADNNGTDDKVTGESSGDLPETTTAGEALLELTERAVETLEAFGRLVIVCGSDGAPRSASIHGAIQKCIQKELGTSCPSLRQALTSRFHGYGIEFAERREMELWRPSVVAFLSLSSDPAAKLHGEEGTIALDAKLRSSIGILLRDQGLYRQAAPYLEQATEDRRAELRERHPNTLSSINSLAGLYLSQGRYAEAEPLYLEALEGRRAELGERHPDTLGSIYSLATLYSKQGRYAEAEPLLLEAVEGMRAELGKRHPDTLGSIDSPAAFYLKQGRYAEAEPLLLEALDGMRTELGQRHPDTLSSIHSLAALYSDQGRYAEAEPLLLEALEGRRAELRERHPNTLSSINNLANLYSRQGRYAEAEPLLLEALEGMRAELRERHPDILSSIHSLAALYLQQGRYAEAEPLLLEALEGRRAELRERHPNTLGSINNLANLYSRQGRYAEAEPLLLEALEGTRAELGQRHPDTLGSINSLALLYSKQGRYAEAEPLSLEVLEGRRAELRERHPDTLGSIGNLATLYSDQGRNAEAEPLLLEALEGMRAELGQRHPDTLGSINNLVVLHMTTENYLSAAPLLLAGLKTIYGHKCGEPFNNTWNNCLIQCWLVLSTRGPR